MSRSSFFKILYCKHNCKCVLILQWLYFYLFYAFQRCFVADIGSTLGEFALKQFKITAYLMLFWLGFLNDNIYCDYVTGNKVQIINKYWIT